MYRGQEALDGVAVLADGQLDRAAGPAGHHGRAPQLQAAGGMVMRKKINDEKNK